VNHALGVARSRAGRARTALDPIGRSPARESLLALTEFVTARSR